ncbi:hypothetical protein [Pseudomonas sp. NPDC089734]|uniref:hypothetical protein n=1 Tax=Pseudomonas sp. NPDC089734 TaxID=3364469 RepID=UPI0037F5FAE4
MDENLIRVRDRLIHYELKAGERFKTDSGFKYEDEEVLQKLRQYWADETISNAVKLQGFDLDLSGFDPRNTSFNEMKGIGILLMDLGIIDQATRSGLDYAGVEFDAQGYQINKDKKVDAFEYLYHSLEFLKDGIRQGHGYMRDSVVKVDLAITVLLALEERAQKSRSASSVDTHI